MGAVYPEPALGSFEAAAVRPISVGVIGAGEQATTRLLPALSRLPNVRLAALADVDEARGRAVAERLGVPHRFAAASRLLAEVDVDALIAACPPQAHEEIVGCAIERRVPVFVEKPPTVTTARLRELAARAAVVGVVTGVGMNLRYAGPYLRIKELLKAPETGAVVSVSVRHLASKPRAPLWGLPLLRSFLLAQTIHPVDLMLDLAGPAVDLKVLRRVDDHGVLLAAQVEFATGAVGGLLAGTHAPRFDTRIEVITDAGVTISLAGLSELTIAGLPAAAAVGGSRGWSQQWRPSPLDSGYERTGFLGELEGFCGSVTAGEPFRPGLGDLLPVYDLIDALDQT